MRKKKCSKCKTSKVTTEFHKRSSAKDGLQPQCKVCTKLIAKRYYEVNQEKVKKRSKLWQEVNPEKVRENKKRWYENNSEKVKKRSKLWQEVNPEKVRESGKRYREANPEKVRESHKRWKEANPEKMRKSRNRRCKERYASDPEYRLGRLFSRQIYQMTKSQGGSKRGSVNQKWCKILGYTKKQLCDHLEKQFTPEMNWDNQGSVWHIDHIYPHSLLPYDNEYHPNVRRAWALANLKPLPGEENMKKSDKILYDLPDPQPDIFHLCETYKGKP